MATYLPQELVDRIIDHLHGNPKTLFSCSLVCSRWVSRSRYQLGVGFKRIVLARGDTSTLKILSSPLCTISPFIRDLEVNFTACGKHFKRYAPDIPSYLTNLTVLSISDGGLPLAAPNITFSKGFPHVSELTFNFPLLSPVPSQWLARIINSSQGLEMLSISFAVANAPGMDIDDKLTTMHRLKKLQLWNFNASTVYFLLGQPSLYASVSQLRISVWDIQLTKDLLIAIGGSLEFLHLDVGTKGLSLISLSADTYYSRALYQPSF